MSTVIAKNVQVGTSGTATDNFTIFQPATPDGTLRIGNGNTGITTSQVALTSAGNLGVGTNSPSFKLDVTGTFRSTGEGRFDNGINLKTATLNYVYFDDALSFTRNGTGERMRIDTSGNLQFNSGYGSVATAYGCRAWVNFNGTGTVAIRASGNVSSITDNGTGIYVVNFTTALPDANYAAMASFSPNFGASGSAGAAIAVGSGLTEVAPTTTAFAFDTLVLNAAGTYHDPKYVHVAIFR